MEQCVNSGSDNYYHCQLCWKGKVKLKSKPKCWVEIWVKPKYTKHGIREIVGIYFNPYEKSVKEVIETWIELEFRHQVYGFRTSKG